MKRRVIGIVAAIALAAVGHHRPRDLRAVGPQRCGRVTAHGAGVGREEGRSPRAPPAADIKDSVGQSTVPNNLLADGAVTDLKRLKGLVTQRRARPRRAAAGQPVRHARPSARQGDVPKGLLQVTVKLDPERALGGRVRVGDSVGVLLSFRTGPQGLRSRSSRSRPARQPAATHLQLHKVLVTSVQIAGDATGVPDATDDRQQGHEEGRRVTSGADGRPPRDARSRRAVGREGRVRRRVRNRLAVERADRRT